MSRRDDFDAALDRLRDDGHDADDVVRRAAANLWHWMAQGPKPWTDADVKAVADLLEGDE